MRLVLLSVFISIVCGLTAQEISERVILTGKAMPGSLIIGRAPGAAQVVLNDKTIKSDTSGVFIFAFDRDDTVALTLKVIFKDATTETKIIKPENRTYNIQRINKLEEKYVNPPPDIQKKIDMESRIIADARKTIDTTAEAYFMSGFVRPVDGGRISGVFGSQRILNGQPKNPHNGVDIALPTGSPVYAMADGVVCLKGDDFHYNGNFILLDHGLGLNSVYVHLHKTFVNNGERVSKGQKIGEVGSTGRSTGPHLHWGVQWYKKRIDPQLVIEINL